MRKGESMEDLICSSHALSPEDTIGEPLFPMTQDGSLGTNTIAANVIVTALPSNSKNHNSPPPKDKKYETNRIQRKFENDKRSGNGKSKNDVDRTRRSNKFLDRGNDYFGPIITHSLSVDDSWIQIDDSECSSEIHTKKIPREYKLKVFVLVLSVIIIVSVTLIWYFHHNTQGNINLGDRFILGERSKRLKLENIAGDIVLDADIGTMLPPTNPVWCGSLKEKNNEDRNEICLGFLDMAKLNITRSNHGYKEKSIDCYEVHWSFVYDYELRDCFKLGNSHWYGGGTISGYPYPFENETIDGASFLTGRIQDGDTFGSVLNPIWFNCDGVSIQFDQFTPLHISISHNSKNEADGREMCFTSKCDNISYPADCEISSFKYTICSAEDNSPKTIQGFIKSQQSSNSDASKIETKYITTPIWSTAAVYGRNLTSRYLSSFIGDIAKHSDYMVVEGHSLIIDEGWQSTEGDLEFDAVRFETINQTLKQAKNFGFEVNLVVTPFVFVESEIFPDTAEHHLLISDPMGEVPGLITVDGNIAAVLDPTYNATQVWFIDRLLAQASKYGISSYFFKHGQVSALPYQPHFHSNDISPNDFSNSFNRIASGINSKVVTSSYYGPQNIPIITQMQPMMSSWSRTNGIKGIIAAILAQSAIGNTIVIPPPVGGTTDNSCSDSELFIRWFQLSIFLPVLHLSIPPWHCNHDNKLVREITSELMLIRKNIVIPKLLQTIKNIESNVSDGTELINPIWWVDPYDDVALTISDEFLIGNDTLVAPVLDKDAIGRQVYLPAGTWQDIKGDIHVGQKWVHFDISLKDVLYFIKLPE